MRLFAPDILQVLPKDGIAHYHGPIMNADAANASYKKLLSEIDWQHDEAKIFGKHYVTKRKVAWYADKAYEYRYSGVTKRALVWTEQLLELKSMVEEASQSSYNSCLLNLYHDGSEGMAWHSDAEKTLEHNAPIASLSLGAERKFAFKHKESKETVSIQLEHGSLLVMGAGSQTHWLHRLPPTKKVRDPRINLTFRKILI